jgi:His/Glu/Gln/Arg/opine family amino acid ABC transporter permease subunit
MAEFVDVFLAIVRNGMAITLVVTFGAWLIAISLGILLGILGEHRSWAAREAQFLTCSFLRSVPEILAVYLLFYGLTTSGVNVSALIAAIVALGVVQAGFAGEAVRSCLSLVGVRQRQAAASLGMSGYQMYRHVVIPQIVTAFIPPALNILIGALKISSIAAAVGLNELLFAGRAQIELTHEVLPPAIALAVIYLGVTIPLTRFVAYLERRGGGEHKVVVHAFAFSTRR